jgi:acetyltransferase-like isoleucine patch superfamily enzyme
VAIEVIDEGEQNFVHIARAFLQHGEGRIRIRGDRNRIAIAQPARCERLVAEIGGGSELRIWPDCLLGTTYFHLEREGVLEIGAGCGFNGRIHIFLHEQGAVRIGRHCLFGDGVEITVSDMHSIVDLATGRRLNPPKDVTVEDGAWVGADAALLKGAHVGAGSVIGMRAVVTGAIPPHCVAAGVPARVLRRNVRWTPELLAY